MDKIKFGTDGWRAIIAKEFTTENVARVSHGASLWLKRQSNTPTVVVGHDCRFAGELFAETVAKTYALNGVKVYLAKGFITTPMISLGTLTYKANLGIVITASHNPPSYNGYKLKGSYGGPLLPEQITEVEALIPDTNPHKLDEVSIESLQKQNLIEYVDLETLYVNHVEKNFDLEAIRNSKLEFAYDAMFGAGQNVMRRLFPDITFLHCEYNPSFEGIAPEPILKNLQQFSEVIKESGNISVGLATDGDADRIGLFDSKGNFVDSHHIILLLIHYLVKYKGFNGKVCTAFSTTVKIKNICKHYNLPLEVVQIGFKHICGIMIKEDVLLGGEESGGIAIKGHIPERDGIWMGLTIWEFMAKSGKSLEQLIEEVYAITGPFAFERSDLHIDERLKQRVLENCRNGKYNAFGDYKVARVEDLDGYKYFLSEDEWFMIRASGTEPILRTYAESSTKEKALDILKAGYKTLMN